MADGGYTSSQNKTPQPPSATTTTNGQSSSAAVAAAATASSSSRNFRSAYYEKLGFCGNEEKNILDLLIASCPFGKNKSADQDNDFGENEEDIENRLNLFLGDNDHHSIDRRCIETWKVLLGVECDRKNPFDEFANVRKVRTEHFQSLKHNLEVLLRHNIVIKRKRLNKISSTNTTTNNKPQPLSDNHKHSQENCTSELQQQPSSNATENDQVATSVTTGGDAKSTYSSDHENALIDSVGRKGRLVSKQVSGKDNDVLEIIETNPGMQITLMYLLEAGRLDSSDIDAQLESTYCRKMSAIALFFVNVSSDLQEAFFLFRNFSKKLEENETLDNNKLQQINNNKTWLLEFFKIL